LDGDGKCKLKFAIPNMITNSGRQFIASRMFTNSQPIMNTIAIGTSDTPVQLNNPTLGGEIARAFFSYTNLYQNVITYRATFGPGVGTGTLKEAATHSDTSGGQTISRVVFPAFVKAAPDTLIVEWIYEIL
jgi:hypothetical protein